LARAAGSSWFSAVGIANLEMRHLSMGMSACKPVAIEERANIMHLGTKLFGPLLAIIVRILYARTRKMCSMG